MALPLDVIGLRVESLALVDPGHGYAAGDVVRLAGGQDATARYDGHSWSVADPHWHGCAPTGPVGQASPPASGGSGVRFAPDLLRPIAYGTIRLGSCAVGDLLTVARRDSGTTRAIGTRPDGSLDEAALDDFTRGTVQEVKILRDQGGGHLDAVPRTSRPVLFAPRRLGQARSVVLDHATLVIPRAFGVDIRNNTIAGVIGTRSVDYHPGVIGLGFGPAKVWLSQGDTRPTLAYTTGAPGSPGTGIADSHDSLRDTPSIAIGTSTDGAGLLWLNGRIARSTTTATGTTTDGGFIAQDGASDGVAWIAAPFGLDEAELHALAASLAARLGLPPTPRNLLVVVGHSLNEGTGTAYQQGWPRQMAQHLGRPDLAIVNTAHAGATCVQALASFEAEGVPAIRAAPGANKVVSILCGDNDFAGNTALTTAQLAALYGLIADAAHREGARTLCIEPPFANRAYGPTGGGPALSATEANMHVVAPLGIAIAARLGTSCDAVTDEKALPPYSHPAGPYLPRWYADGIHPTNAGAALIANLIGHALTPLLR